MIKIMKYADVSNSELFCRSVSASNIGQTVAEIISDVRTNGDAAIKKYNERFDHAVFDVLEVTSDELNKAYSDVSPELIAVMERAAENIRAFHENQKRSGFMITGGDGIVLGQRVIALERVGLYIPGGTASYPSSVLMNGIPAKIAGVSEIIMTTPASGGSVNNAILAAAKIAGIDRIFKVGGAQAIAALAYGTQSIPRVDKIVGPGNAFVAEAKKQVYGTVAIDMIAGPSEILIVADKSCDPSFVAADMLSQAEHDKLASAVLVTDSEALANAVSEELEKQLAALPRQEIARASIDNNGKIIVAQSLFDAIEIANQIAPEHLELSVDDPFDYLSRVKNAGSVFLGKYCPESLGDYYAGPNHTLPTMGTARFSSPLSVDDFVKRSSFTYYTQTALEKAAADIAAFAECEGLHAHARAALIRRERS